MKIKLGRVVEYERVRGNSWMMESWDRIAMTSEESWRHCSVGLVVGCQGRGEDLGGAAVDAGGVAPAEKTPNRAETGRRDGPCRPHFWTQHQHFS
jgi:hypothetical protein